MFAAEDVSHSLLPGWDSLLETSVDRDSDDADSDPADSDTNDAESCTPELMRADGALEAGSIDLLTYPSHGDHRKRWPRRCGESAHKDD